MTTNTKDAEREALLSDALALFSRYQREHGAKAAKFDADGDHQAAESSREKARTNDAIATRIERFLARPYSPTKGAEPVAWLTSCIGGDSLGAVQVSHEGGPSYHDEGWTAAFPVYRAAQATSRRGWRLVPCEITPEMAQQLESNIAHCLPPSEVHRANWADAWKNAIAAAPQPPTAGDPVVKMPTRGEIVKLWRKHGGGQHGPRVETMTIPLDRFHDFVAEVLSVAPPPADIAPTVEGGDVFIEAAAALIDPRAFAAPSSSNLLARELGTVERQKTVALRTAQFIADLIPAKAWRE